MPVPSTSPLLKKNFVKGLLSPASPLSHSKPKQKPNPQEAKTAAQPGPVRQAGGPASGQLRPPARLAPSEQPKKTLSALACRQMQLRQTEENRGEIPKFPEA